jgi:hypothetical protein
LLLGLCSAAALANANGVAGIVYPAHLFGELWGGVAWFPAIGELTSPLSYPVTSPLQPEFFYWILVALCVAAAFANRRNARFADWLPTLAFMILSLRSLRNTPLFAIVAMLFTVENVTAAWGAALSRLRLRARTVAVASLAAMLLVLGGVSGLAATNTLYEWLHWHRRFGLAESATYPSSIVERLRETPGRFYNDTSMGGYLIWKLYPDKQVAIDGRWEVYGELMPRLNATIQGPRTFAAFAERYDITAIALMPKSAWGRTMLRWLPYSRDFKRTLKAVNVVLYEKVGEQTR